MSLCVYIYIYTCTLTNDKIKQNLYAIVHNTDYNLPRDLFIYYTR